MSTLQSTPRLARSIPASLNAALITVAVMVAIAMTAILASGGTRTATASGVATANDTSAAYAPPHENALLWPTPGHRTGGLTTNNQDSPAYAKATVYNTAR
jgi:hypothetical protein